MDDKTSSYDVTLVKKKQVQETLEEVRNGEIELIDIVKLFEYFLYFSKSKLIMQDIQTLKTVFLNGMNLSSLNSSYCKNVEEELGKVIIRDDNNLGSDAEMDEILQRFKELNEQLLEKEYREEGRSEDHEGEKALSSSLAACDRHGGIDLCPSNSWEDSFTEDRREAG